LKIWSSVSRLRVIAGQVFRMAFWATCGALAVVAAIMIQRAPQVRAEAERQQAAQIATENREYCEKWGMCAETRQYLDEIRAARQAPFPWRRRAAIAAERTFNGNDPKPR
jgi:hypothetical protein